MNDERKISRSPRGDLHRDRHRSAKAAQMMDLQRSKIQPFTRVGIGYVTEQWLITLDRCFAIQDFDSNVKTRYVITNLEYFAVTWWNIEENKLGVDMNIITWELFLENFCDRFLPEE